MGVHIFRIIVYWGLYWGPLILGNYHKAPSKALANSTTEDASACAIRVSMLSHGDSCKRGLGCRVKGGCRVGGEAIRELMLGIV